MTDREKLVRTSNIQNFIEERKYYIDRHVYSDEEKEGAYHILNCLEEWWEILFESDWQPTSRPCFDKPAGTPILHGETVESEEWHKMTVVVTETIEDGKASTTVKVNGETL